MKRITTLFFLLASFTLSGTASALDSVVESVAIGCEQELEQFCANVNPGEGRVLACLYSHEDKLSGKCEYALFEAAAQLQRFISALTYVANECDEDLENFCSAVEAGEGRLGQCLIDNKSKLQARCVTAMEQTDMQVE